MPEATPRERMTRKRPSPQRGAPSAQPPERQKELSEELARATAENARMGGELASARTEIKLLREKVDALIQRLFGAQSEKLDAGQLLLMLQGLEAPGNEVSRSLFPVNLKGQKPRSPWQRRLHGARRSHRLRVRSAARACPITFPSSRKSSCPSR